MKIVNLLRLFVCCNEDLGIFGCLVTINLRYFPFQVVSGSQGQVPAFQEPLYVAKGVRATTVVTPQRVTGAPPTATVAATQSSHPGTPSMPPQGQQQSWRKLIVHNVRLLLIFMQEN